MFRKLPLSIKVGALLVLIIWIISKIFLPKTKIFEQKTQQETNLPVIHDLPTFFIISHLRNDDGWKIFCIDFKKRMHNIMLTRQNGVEKHIFLEYLRINKVNKTPPTILYLIDHAYEFPTQKDLKDKETVAEKFSEEAFEICMAQNRPLEFKGTIELQIPDEDLYLRKSDPSYAVHIKDMNNKEKLLNVNIYINLNGGFKDLAHTQVKELIKKTIESTNEKMNQELEKELTKSKAQYDGYVYQQSDLEKLVFIQNGKQVIIKLKYWKRASNNTTINTIFNYEYHFIQQKNGELTQVSQPSLKKGQEKINGQ